MCVRARDVYKAVYPHICVTVFGTLLQHRSLFLCRSRRSVQG